MKGQRFASLGLLSAAVGFLFLFNAGYVWGVDQEVIAGSEPEKEKKETFYPGLGPLDSRNNSPWQLLFLNFAPDRAKVLAHKQMEVKLNEVYSNTINEGKSDHWRALMDMEVSRAAFQFKLGLWDRVELGLEIPYIYQWHGTLDTAINGFHRTFGLRRRSHAGRKDNQYHFHLIKDDEIYLQGRDRNHGVGDIVVDVKIQLLPESKYLPAISIKPALKIPSGDARLNMGSGKADGGIAVLMEKNYWRFHGYVNLGVVFTGQNSRKANVRTHEIYHVLAGLEYSLTEDLSAHVQIVMNTSPLRHTGIKFLDEPGVEVDFGLKYRIHKYVILQLAMIQDITTGTPDVSLIGGIKITF